MIRDEDNPNEPDLPYAGTSGWSGSDTSRERAERDDSDGTTSKRQQDALTDLRHREERGLTWKELGQIERLHHGQASSVLSVLHKVGKITRLTERRHRCAVYVRHEFVGDRETSPYRPNKAKRRVTLATSPDALEAVETAFNALVEWWMTPTSVSDDDDYDEIKTNLLSVLDGIVRGEEKESDLS